MTSRNRRPRRAPAFDARGNLLRPGQARPAPRRTWCVKVDGGGQDGIPFYWVRAATHAEAVIEAHRVLAINGITDRGFEVTD